MTPENRNLILAVALSMAVLFGWQLLVIQPELEKEQARQAELVENRVDDNLEDSESNIGIPKVGAIENLKNATVGAGTEEKLSTIESKRITIDAPLVQGSFSL